MEGKKDIRMEVMESEKIEFRERERLEREGLGVRVVAWGHRGAR